ncbi:MAG TPA: oxalurate catabolism protein HpxZ [Methylomirabilota bacterium]
MDLNIPEVVAEVTDAFNRYETALTTNDVPALDSFFWNDPRVIRFSLSDNGYGFEAIMKARRARNNVDLRRRLMRTVVTAFGRDFATVNTEFKREDSGREGRQSQTWVRTAEGWKVVNAHVSWLTPPP